MPASSPGELLRSAIARRVVTQLLLKSPAFHFGRHHGEKTSDTSVRRYMQMSPLA
jgi:hypothetical protein